MVNEQLTMGESRKEMRLALQKLAGLVERAKLEPGLGEGVGRAFWVEHGRLEVEVEVALAARGQRDLAAAERTLADDLGEAGAGGRFGQGDFPRRLRRAAIYRRFPAHSSADPAPSTGHGVPQRLYPTQGRHSERPVVRPFGSALRG